MRACGSCWSRLLHGSKLSGDTSLTAAALVEQKFLGRKSIWVPVILGRHTHICLVKAIVWGGRKGLVVFMACHLAGCPMVEMWNQNWVWVPWRCQHPGLSIPGGWPWKPRTGDSQCNLAWARSRVKNQKKAYFIRFLSNTDNFAKWNRNGD